MVAVTDCVVTQQRYNRRRQFPTRKNGVWTSCKIETLKQIFPKFVTVDYVYVSTLQAKFGKSPFTGTTEQIRENRNITS